MKREDVDFSGTPGDSLGPLGADLQEPHQNLLGVFQWECHDEYHLGAAGLIKYPGGTLSTAADPGGGVKRQHLLRLRKLRKYIVFDFHLCDSLCSGAMCSIRVLTPGAPQSDYGAPCFVMNLPTPSPAAPIGPKRFF